MTLALESTTAIESFVLPIRHVQEACQFWKLVDSMCFKIASSLVTFESGTAYLTAIDFMACVSKKERARMKACTATSRSVGCESWFELTMGKSRVELEVMLTQPLDKADTGATMTVPYRLLGSELPTAVVAPISYSNSGQSVGNMAKSALEPTLSLLRYGSVMFS